MFAVSISFLPLSSLLPQTQSRTCGPRTDWWNSSLDFLYLDTDDKYIFLSIWWAQKFLGQTSDMIFILQSQCSKDRSRSVKLRRKCEVWSPSKSEMCKFSTRVNCWWTFWSRNENLHKNHGTEAYEWMWQAVAFLNISPTTEFSK